MAEASRHGNQYTNTYIYGGRSHLGNVYNNYGPSSDEQALRSILESLSYDGMDDRRDTMTNAGRGTFDWTLAEEEMEAVTSRWIENDGSVSTYSTTIDIGFTRWLKGEDEDLFCFMGKPGSGKSTLMYIYQLHLMLVALLTQCDDRKYLATDWRVDEALKTWTKGTRIIRAEHFFWMLGVSMQKSREGLLRSLLHSLLQTLIRNAESEDIEIVKHACGHRWSSSSRRAWDCEELYQILASLTSVSTTKYLLLVDALDECEPQDLPGEIAAEVLRISRLPNVKLCISCRPWKSFVARFSQIPILYLDQLTYRDMEIYVETRLVSAESESGLHTEFRDKTVEATKFVNEVVQAAEGVFLWIELVLKALCSDLRKGSDFDQLRSTLAEFPVDLDHYFQRFIFDRITRTHRNNNDTAAALKLALGIAKHASGNEHKSSPCPNSFLNFWLLKSGWLRPGFSWEDHTGRWYTPENIQEMVSQTKSFLEESCKDLLVMIDMRRYPYPPIFYSEMRWDVRFIHRTVADFLRDNCVNSLADSGSSNDFADASFRGDLDRLRSMCILSEQQAGCEVAEQHFSDILDGVCSQSLNLHDMQFISACETRMVQRFDLACNCLGVGHNYHNTVVPCAEIGLTDYILTGVRRWPHLAVKQCFRGKNSVGALLDAVIQGWLVFACSTLENIADAPLDPPLNSGLDGATSWHLGSLRQARVDYPNSFVRSSPGCSGGESYIRLIDHVFTCGGDPNGRCVIRDDLSRNQTSPKCRITVWESYLVEVFRQLRALNRKEGDSKRHANASERVRRFKNMVCDMIVLFLRFGADPGCSPCVSDHRDGSCLRVSLPDILASIIPAERLTSTNNIRILTMVQFESGSSQRGQKFRAIKSLLMSERKRMAHSENTSNLDNPLTDSWWQIELEDFLIALTTSSNEHTCNSCGDIQMSSRSVWCIDCSGHFRLCEECSRPVKVEIWNGDVSGKNTTHDSSSPDESHAYLVFGWHYPDNVKRMYGVEESLSVLRGWYARNTVGEDAGVD